jgi:hypothetical protein
MLHVLQNSFSDFIKYFIFELFVWYQFQIIYCVFQLSVKNYLMKVLMIPRTNILHARFVVLLLFLVPVFNVMS